MLLILNLEKTCTACGACVSVCPKQALSLEYNDDGFYFPKLNSSRCINCRMCERVCHALKRDKEMECDHSYTPYMAKSLSDEIVRKSSSGGIFSLLADEVLKQDGVVYGAKYNYKLERLEHVSTDSCDLSELRKSKYIESYMGDTFLRVSDEIKKGRSVLFCGTPCQIKGLKTFLNSINTEFNNLLLVRILCHGVPSNKHFTEYKHWLERKHSSKILSIDFRPKIHGWQKQYLCLSFENGRMKNILSTESYYLQSFYQNAALRRSCYDCSIVCENGCDITLADFWGILKYKPESNDDKGLSLILVHSVKGSRAIQAITEYSKIDKIPLQAVEYIFGDSKEDLIPFRNNTTKFIREKGYIAAMKGLYTKSIIIRILKRRIKSFLRK